MAATTMKNVDLGFVEKTDSWRLSSHFFPSKVGGATAWLSLKPVPSAENLACRECGKPCVFLVQIYAPENDTKSCFHRTLFLFVCREPGCCRRDNASNFVVVRSQLPRENDFYSFDSPDESSAVPDAPSASQHQSLCVVCGCAGPKRCSQCHATSYCSKHHQTLHWKAGHKRSCSKHTGDNPETSVGFLFPELELVIESEDLDEKSASEKDEETRVKEYEEFLAANPEKVSELQDAASKKDLEKMAMSEAQTDKAFAKFKKRVDLDPDQVLRYQRGGHPLWVSDEGIPSDDDIPDCQCGAPRQFEFQVLPQLLSHLGVDSLGDSLDWGTLLIYTCSKHCDIGNQYQAEFVWKQDFSHQELQPPVS